MLDRIRRRVLFSRGFRGLVRMGRRIVLPGFEGFSLYEVARLFFRALFDGNLVTRASAIAFKLFVAFFPALIVVITLVSHLPFLKPEGELLETIHQMLPDEVHRFLLTTIADLSSRSHGTLLSFSFVGAVYLASNSIDAILRGFSGSSNVTTWHSPWKQRLLSVGLLFALVVALAIAIPVLTASGAMIKLLVRHEVLTSGLQVVALHVARWTVAITMLLLGVSLLYHVGQPGSRKFRLFTPGAIVTVVLVCGLARVIAFVFAHITDYNVVYGSIGAILAVQLWLYLNMMVVLIGYELNVAIRRAQHDHSAHLLLQATRAQRASA